MKTFVLFLLALALAGARAWGNGDIVRYDPNTGVILPAGPTQVRVERERLDIEFQPVERRAGAEGPRRDIPPEIRTVKVRAQYWLHNPTDKPLQLDIGFPAPGGGVELVEAPVHLDGQPGDWRLLNYDDLLKPVQPSLIRAMQRWTDRHPRAVQLAQAMRPQATHPARLSKRDQKRQALWEQLRAELIKAGVHAPNRDASMSLYPSVEAPRIYQERWALRAALMATGQRHLLPEGRWYVDSTYLDPATGREAPPRRGEGYEQTVSLLTFPLRLQSNSRHHLEVAYQQRPSQRYDEPIYDFAYVLRTVRGWASFGPIETTIKAPASLVCRSLPTLRYAGMSGGLKVYRGVIVQPKRNLQVVLASERMLLPRLKVNSHLRERYDMLVGGNPTAPLSTYRPLLPYLDQKRWQRGEIVLARDGVTLRARPGEKRMLVNGQPVPLRTPILVRKGTSYLPLEAWQTLFPDYQITLIYHAPSRTVLLDIKPKRRAPESPQPAAKPKPRAPEPARPATKGPA